MVLMTKSPIHLAVAAGAGALAPPVGARPSDLTGSLAAGSLGGRCVKMTINGVTIELESALGRLRDPEFAELKKAITFSTSTKFLHSQTTLDVTKSEGPSQMTISLKHHLKQTTNISARNKSMLGAVREAIASYRAMKMIVSGETFESCIYPSASDRTVVLEELFAKGTFLAFPKAGCWFACTTTSIYYFAFVEKNASTGYEWKKRYACDPKGHAIRLEIDPALVEEIARSAGLIRATR